MAEQNHQLAIFPDLPRDWQVVDKDGQITSQWQLFFDQLITALQSNLKPEGFVIPQQTASNIALLTSSLSNIIYDSTNNVFKGNVQITPTTFTWKTFSMS